MDAASGAQLDEPGRHLAAAGVVDADEQHLGHLLRHEPLRLGECLQPLAREAMREHGHEDVDLARAEQVDRLGDVALDRLPREDAGELVGERVGGLPDVMLGDRVEHLAHGSSSARQQQPAAAAGWTTGQALALRVVRLHGLHDRAVHPVRDLVGERDADLLEPSGFESCLVLAL